MSRLKWLEVEGFRSFSIKQRLDFEKELALVWGGNSQGKTSVAEAVEFLLTGDTVRRTLLGGERSEYNASLRCAHHPDGGQVQVSAGIVDDSGTDHTVVRTLNNDLARGQDPSSTLTIDGNEATGLSNLGIVLSEPPLRAPVLFQHSVRYALSARPTDRLTYFKALLEMGDLDAMSRALTAAISSFTVPPAPLEQDLGNALADDVLRPLLAALTTTAPSNANVERQLRRAVGAAVNRLGGQRPNDQADLSQLADALEADLDQNDQQRFDLRPWHPGNTPSLTPDQLVKTENYAHQVREVDAEAERLRALFEAVLAVPAYAELKTPIDCPVCGTQEALTPGRIAELREHIAAASGLRQAQDDARSELNTLRGQIQAAKNALAAVAPAVASWDDRQVVAASSQATTVLGEAADLREAHEKAVELASTRDTATERINEAIAAADAALSSIAQAASIDPTTIENAASAAAIAITSVGVARADFITCAAIVLTPVRDRLASQSGTQAQRALLRLTRNFAALGDALRKRHALAKVKAEYGVAASDIERAKLAVLNTKFGGMSAEIERWWKLLRPDEPVDFLKAAPRGQGLRGVSLEAALHKSDGTHHIRDALGGFSDSQLNALGLAAFLARASLQQTPLVVLDDPLQSGDEAHRDTFIDRVVPELLAAQFQVLITTYDHKLNRFLTQAQDLDGFQVSLDDPTDGSVIVKGSHSAKALLRDAKEYLGEGQARRWSCATRLRVAAEAVAKEILVAKRDVQGDRASLADYAGKTLEALVPLLREHVDETEYRWWTMVSGRVSPGAHDDAPPEKNTLKMVYDGLLNSIRKHL